MSDEKRAKNTTADGLAEKGSKRWMQKIANPTSTDFVRDTDYMQLQAYKKCLEYELSNSEGELEWVSPRLNENYHEYRLNEINHGYELNEIKRKNIRREILELDDTNFKTYFKFWPSKGHPVWDAIALSADKTELFLFEAKAHIKEMETKCGSKSTENRNIIEKAMFEACKYFSVDSVDVNRAVKDIWMEKYYQLGNRLTFLYYMNNYGKNRDIVLPKIKKITLVLLNIVNDKYGKTGITDWENYYSMVFQEMTGYNIPPQDVKILKDVEVLKDVKVLFIPNGEQT